MAVMDAVAQAAFFRTQLGATLPPLQVAAFEADLVRANLEFMDPALQQVAAAAAAAGSPPHDARKAVWAEYHRRVAEVDRLFPVFFTFESAWRALTGEVLKARYGGSDAWWHPVRAAVQAGAGSVRLGFLGGVPARNDVIRRVENLLRNQPPSSRAALATSYDLVGAGTLGDVGWFIDNHWGAVASVFSAPAGGAPTSTQFAALFRRVREARNDAYHHRPVPSPKKVVDAAERLLDLIDVHLGTRVAAVAASTPAPFAFALPLQPRHR